MLYMYKCDILLHKYITSVHLQNTLITYMYIYIIFDNIKNSLQLLSVARKFLQKTLRTLCTMTHIQEEEKSEGQK